MPTEPEDEFRSRIENDKRKSQDDGEEDAVKPIVDHLSVIVPPVGLGNGGDDGGHKAGAKGDHQEDEHPRGRDGGQFRRAQFRKHPGIEQLHGDCRVLRDDDGECFDKHLPKHASIGCRGSPGEDHRGDPILWLGVRQATANGRRVG